MKVMIFGLLMVILAISVVFFFDDELTSIIDNINIDKKKKTEVEKENIKTPVEDKKIKKL